MKHLTSHQMGWLTKHLNRFMERAIIIDLLTMVYNRPTITLQDEQFAKLSKDGVELGVEQLPKGEYQPGDITLVTTGKRNVYGYFGSTGETVTLHLLSDDVSLPPIGWFDTLDLGSGVIANYDGPPIKTSFGRLLMNQLCFAIPFGNAIPYLNDAWKPGEVQGKVSALLRQEKVTTKQVKEFLNNSFYLGSLSTLFVSTATKKSFITDPNIAKRKKELLEEYQGRLDDPIIIKRIENELIAMDKKFIGDDRAADFYNAMGKKAYDLHRKNMFLAVGGVESFNKGSKSYSFISNSLAEGWDPKDFPTIVDELRKGSYNRGVATMDGGALAKALQRVFQNIEIIEDDCGTKRTIQIELTSKNIYQFEGRTVAFNGNFVLLTKDVMPQYIGKTVGLRTPMMCQAKPGLCYTCCGQIYRQLGQKGITVFASQVANKFMLNSMKAMHGSTIETVKVDVGDYLVPH